MQIWSAEIKELESLFTSIKGRFPELEKELEQLMETKDVNVILIYSRRCLEVIITDLCETELKRPRKTEPLKGIIDKLNREEKIPSHIVVSMQYLNSLATFGAHPKDFDPEQVKPVLNNLAIIIKWYLKYMDSQAIRQTKPEEVKSENKEKFETENGTWKSKKRLILLFSGILLVVIIVIAALFIFNNISDRKQMENLINPEKSIAVLPFENMSDNQEYSYFGDAMTDEIIMQLCKINEFIVRSRTSVLQYKATEKTSPVIGRELNVNYLIEGSAQRFEDKIRIRVQLIHAPTDNHLWGEIYESNWKDILSVQGEIAKQIAGELKTVLTPEEIQKIDKEPTKNTEAYDFYLRGKDYYERGYELQNYNMAIRMYQKAIELDPDFALAFTGLAMTHLEFYWFYYDRREDRLQKSKQAIDAAFKLEPELTEAYIALGDYYYRGLLDYSNALKQFEIALSQSPNNSQCIFSIAAVYRRAGNWEKSLENFKKAFELDPGSSMAAYNTGETYELLREYPEALHYCDTAIMLRPEWIYPYYLKSVTYVKLTRNTQQARDILKEANQIITSPDDSRLYSSLGIAYAGLGMKKEAIEAGKKAVELLPVSKEAYRGTFRLEDLARIYVMTGEYEKALKQLKLLLSIPGPLSANLLKSDPIWKPLQDNPDFIKLLETYPEDK